MLDAPGTKKRAAMIGQSDKNPLPADDGGDTVCVSPPVLQGQNGGLRAKHGLRRAHRRFGVVAFDKIDDEIDGPDGSRVVGRTHVDTGEGAILLFD